MSNETEGARDSVLDESVQNLLAQLASPDGRGGTNGHQREVVQNYRKKLQTFKTSTYFAKPIEISPVICALTGWEVYADPAVTSALPSQRFAGMDADTQATSSLLRCCDCQAYLAILIPFGLSVKALQNLTAHYQRQLWIAHSIACCRRKQAEYFIETALTALQKQTANRKKCNNTHHSSKPSAVVLPWQLAHVLPEPALELLEQSNPWVLFLQQIETMSKHIPDSSTSISGPDAFLESVDRIVQVIMNEKQGDASTTDLSSAKAAAALVLTGWSLQVKNNREVDAARDNNQFVTVACSLCLASQILLPLTAVAALNATSHAFGHDEERRRKRPRCSANGWNRPLDAHRYYCPWVCGMVVASASEYATPFWQIAAENLERNIDTVSSQISMEGESAQHPDSFVEIHQLLRAGLSSQRIDPSTFKD